MNAPSHSGAEFRFQYCADGAVEVTKPGIPARKFDNFIAALTYARSVSDQPLVSFALYDADGRFKANPDIS
jgi:hypothetical protein